MDTQIEEAKRTLDTEWQKHVMQTKGVSLTLFRFSFSENNAYFFSKGTGTQGGYQLETPTRETIYKALLTNRSILEAQKTAADRLSRAVKDARIKSVNIGGYRENNLDEVRT